MLKNHCTRVTEQKMQTHEERKKEKKEIDFTLILNTVIAILKCARGVLRPANNEKLSNERHRACLIIWASSTTLHSTGKDA